MSQENLPNHKVIIKTTYTYLKGGLMTDSLDVLSTLKVAYTIYTLIIISLFAWFAYSLVAEHKPKGIVRIPFYGYIAFLVFIGISIHILTFNKVPWVEMDLKRDDIKSDQIFHISMADHKFNFPKEKMIIECGQKILFEVVSDDLTYGFGLFRQGGTMVFQMQVVPGSRNDLLWQFHKNGIYDIRSTEYSGPKGAKMFEDNVVEVRGCDVSEKS